VNGCTFRRNSFIDSDEIRSVIPMLFVHLFRRYSFG